MDLAFTNKKPSVIIRLTVGGGDVGEERRSGADGDDVEGGVEDEDAI